MFIVRCQKALPHYAQVTKICCIEAIVQVHSCLFSFDNNSKQFFCHTYSDLDWAMWHFCSFIIPRFIKKHVFLRLVNWYPTWFKSFCWDSCVLIFLTCSRLMSASSLFSQNLSAIVLPLGHATSCVSKKQLPMKHNTGALHHFHVSTDLHQCLMIMAVVFWANCSSLFAKFLMFWLNTTTYSPCLQG